MGTTRPVEVLDNLPGSSIGRYHWDGSVLNVELRDEPLVHADGVTHDYSLHFVFGMRNPIGSNARVTVGTTGRGPRDLTLGPGRIYSSPSLDDEFVASESPALTDRYSRFEWSVELAPGETRYWSNTLWRPYPLVSTAFPRLAENAGLTAYVYGESIEGRELVAYHSPDLAEDTTRANILITSGFHPVEGDTLGTEAIFEWMAGEGKSALDRYNVVVVPVANPDGFAHANNGCNAAGVNFYWDFRRHDRESCPEAYHLWRLIQRYPPVVYVDFHSYSVHGARKYPGPYIKPQLFYWGLETKALARELTQCLDAIPGTKPQSPFAPSSLAYQITDELNTVTFAKYHLHQDLGKNGMKQLAVTMLACVLNVLNANGYSAADLLLKPYGKVSKRINERIIRWSYGARYTYPRRVRRTLQRVLGGR